MKISRRELAGVALAGVASAQQAGPDELAEARKKAARDSEILLNHEISMTAEPAFQFKA